MALQYLDLKGSRVQPALQVQPVQVSLESMERTASRIRFLALRESREPSASPVLLVKGNRDVMATMASMVCQFPDPKAFRALRA